MRRGITQGLGRMMKLGVYVALAALALSSLAPAGAEETAEERYARFQLFANCEPVRFVVGYRSQDAQVPNLTKESVVNSVESRLRSARLYEPDNLTILEDNSALLEVNVNIALTAFTIRFKLYKIVKDLYTDITFLASTWEIGFIGTHGNDAGFILNNISQHMDEFLVAYLRANEEACAKR